MFDQKKYVNSYIKENYRDIKIRVRKDDGEVMEKLSSTKNVNAYILGLIRKDIEESRPYRFINGEVEIDFPLPKVIQDLARRAEKADRDGDYGLYMNLADAIDSRAKREVSQHRMSEAEWNRLLRRYAL